MGRKAPSARRMRQWPPLGRESADFHDAAAAGSGVALHMGGSWAAGQRQDFVGPEAFEHADVAPAASTGPGTVNPFVDREAVEGSAVSRSPSLSQSVRSGRIGCHPGGDRQTLAVARPVVA